eukprot:CAMPEP_0201119740 /NCGR_PEP_ID=MMETSP0850-20130426/3854_1 /ASSEMBLY_ACC=CAM_ASM_000622 /TAXON_ID=183588 /ORGANISM="Pseudo-nitzschia fraudulenta, Strain WWA7" /LENGTH=211 /DNA_ID=CAMNT_0047385585 /DNA_START=164 /DNA_END=799 /DNA_ORIENTATION=+
MTNSPSNKRRLALVLFLSWSSSALSFTLSCDRSFPARAFSAAATPAPVAARSGSTCLAASDFDFPSAMPEKPELTLEEKMNQSADDFLENMDNSLADKSTAPPELEVLREARKANAPVEDITRMVYDLMIERAMRYDEDLDTGSLTPTGFDIPNNLEVPEVKKEFKHLYSYGMMLMNRKLLDAEVLKETVIERLIKRTGLTPEEFDKWLGY